jgi:uncharacterized protein (DUF1501 family)
VAGGGIRPGLHGSTPSLAPGDLAKGDPVHGTDYRAVYATVLEKRLGADAQPILGKSFPLLGFA